MVLQVPGPTSVMRQSIKESSLPSRIQVTPPAPVKSFYTPAHFEPAGDAGVIQRRFDFTDSKAGSIKKEEFESFIATSGSQELIGLHNALEQSKLEIYYRAEEGKVLFGVSGGAYYLNIPEGLWIDYQKGKISKAYLASFLGHEMRHAYDKIIDKKAIFGVMDQKLDSELNAWSSQCIVAIEMAETRDKIDKESLGLIHGFRQCVFNRSYNLDEIDYTGNGFLSVLAHYCFLYSGADSKEGVAKRELNDYMKRNGNRQKVIDACFRVFIAYDEKYNS